jgi:hypothetical protein
MVFNGIGPGGRLSLSNCCSVGSDSEEWDNSSNLDLESDCFASNLIDTLLGTIVRGSCLEQKSL